MALPLVSGKKTKKAIRTQKEADNEAPDRTDRLHGRIEEKSEERRSPLTSLCESIRNRRSKSGVYPKQLSLLFTSGALHLVPRVLSTLHGWEVGDFGVDLVGRVEHRV
jgi:hypothetical protein